MSFSPSRARRSPPRTSNAPSPRVASSRRRPSGGLGAPFLPARPDSDDVPLTNATGAISDGSGPGLYLPHTDCTWIVRPSTLAPPPDPDGASPTLPPSPPDDGGITLVFERFDTVFDDDFLYVTDPDASDAVPARPRELALYTGALPVPFAVRFDAVAALTLRFVAGDNRDEGFCAPLPRRRLVPQRLRRARSMRPRPLRV